ncbi:MAG: sodium:calcium antiporter [Actinomycetota bacterium]
MSPWLVFLLSAAAVIVAGSRLSRDGDAIAEGTGLGGAWVGAILVAGATSLPELATDVYAVRAGDVNLAVGDLFGSCMANMLILGVADLLHTKVQVLTRVAINQVLVGVLAISLVALAILGIVAHVPATMLGAGWSAWAIGVGYVAGMRLLHLNRGEPPFQSVGEAEEAAAQVRRHSLRRAYAGFALSALVILFAARYLASSAGEIALLLGLSSGLVGMVLVALTTSLPEVTVSIAAVRSGSYDLAVGNLLGSNCFNIAILFVLDFVDGPAALLGRASPSLAVGAVFAILLMSQALIGILNRSERRVGFFEPDATLLVLTYFGGLYPTYLAGH